MTRIYINLFIGFIVLSTVGLSAAFAVGQFRPTNPVLDGMYQGCEGQEQPCWYGIHPGNTTVTDALSKIRETGFYSLKQRGQVFVIVYRSADMRCGVELRSKVNVVDSVTIINCFDRQVGDLVKPMRSVNHKLPFGMGMLDAITYDESIGNIEHDVPCLNYTSYGQIIGMPLGLSGEAVPTKPTDWHDFLPYGWYVHNGGSLSCDVVEVGTNFS
jgi:hypothetical protein